MCVPVQFAGHERRADDHGKSREQSQGGDGGSEVAHGHGGPVGVREVRGNGLHDGVSHPEDEEHDSAHVVGVGHQRHLKVPTMHIPKQETSPHQKAARFSQGLALASSCNFCTYLKRANMVATLANAVIVVIRPNTPLSGGLAPVSLM
uniref:Uncharacterized protein n=1 Tax=Anguilla anguilla TaxID=7936 RepID=A0A0E9WSU9_ANGAN